MAITGTGTELDPWIVHSYDEIKEVFSGSNEVYAQLANDIDCNSYGSDFEWETMGMIYQTSYHLDLNGFTIKNVYIKNDGYLFKGYNSACRYYINNGKILNVFGSSNVAIAQSVNFYNVSMSFQIATPRSSIIDGCSVHNCAIYAIVLNMGSAKLIYYDSNSAIKNVDIYAEIGGCNSTTAYIFTPSGSFTVDSVRVSGKMSPADPSNPTLVRIAEKKLYNSVIDMDMSDFVFNTASNTNLVGAWGDKTTVINVSTINTNVLKVDSNDYLLAQSNQAMRTGSDLRSLGFSVVNV